MNLARLRLVTFDVTGTILKFRSPPAIQYGQIGQLYGVSCDEKELIKNFNTQWKKMTKEHPNFGKVSGIGWEKWWKKVVFGTFQDAKADEKTLDVVANHLIECYKTMDCWEQSYGALGLISYLRNKNINLGVVSNFDERLYEILRNAHLRHYFQFVLTSYAAGFEKPDPRLFEEAMILSQIPDLKPQQCLHIGDKPELDIAGAKKAGWNALLVSELKFDDVLRRYSYIKQEDVFKNLYELHKYFSGETILLP